LRFIFLTTVFLFFEKKIKICVSQLFEEIKIYNYSLQEQKIQDSEN